MDVQIQETEEGHEIDVYMNWRIASDLFWTIRYGVFFPGGAFTTTKSSRHFLFTGVTWSF